MRRILMLAGLSMLLLVSAAGVAVAVSVAANKFCNDIPCEGTNNDDQLIEREGNHVRDRILGLDGKDVIDAGIYHKDRDVVEGGPKDDTLHTDDNDGRDTARGDRGDDVCFVDRGDVTSSCTRHVR